VGTLSYTYETVGHTTEMAFHPKKIKPSAIFKYFSVSRKPFSSLDNRQTWVNQKKAM